MHPLPLHQRRQYPATITTVSAEEVGFQMNAGKQILQPTQKKFAKPFCDRAGCSIYSQSVGEIS